MRTPVAIADDNIVFLEGLSDLTNSFPEFEVVVRTNDGKKLLEYLESGPVKPAICIFDISLPVINGYNILKEIKEKWPDIKVLIVSMISNEFNVIRSIKIGANGFLMKGCNAEDLHNALVSIVKTGSYYANLTGGKQTTSEKRDSILLELSYREMDFLSLSCTELTYKGIADRMGVSTRTVESYRSSLFEKLHVNSRIGMVLFALNLGIIPKGGQ